MENRMKNDRSLQGRFVLRVPVLFGAPPVLLFLKYSVPGLSKISHSFCKYIFPCSKDACTT